MTIPVRWQSFSKHPDGKHCGDHSWRLNLNVHKDGEVFGGEKDPQKKQTMRKEKGRGGRKRGLLMLNHSPHRLPPCNHCAAGCWLYHCGPTRAERERGREKEGGIGKSVAVATEQEHVWRQSRAEITWRLVSLDGTGEWEHLSDPLPSRLCVHEGLREYGAGC